VTLLLIFIAIILIVALAIWITFNLVGLIVTLFIAGIIGAIADRIVPGKIPYGFVGAIAAGLLGSWLGTLILGDLGPRIAGIAIIPGLIGAIILAFVAELLFGSKDRDTRRAR
jgi:uncharacterized membrane protein YeaQ/YmgE (transglycosylase-associated protein family)